VKTSVGSTDHPQGKSRVLLLFLSLFLLLSSGRMDSGDANAELAGSMNLVKTGGPGTSTPYSDPLVQSLFVRAPNGRYYEAHDIGNSLLLTPAALVGQALKPRSESGETRATILIAKTLASLIETALSALGCFYLFRLFTLFYKTRPALVLTILFIFATLYTAYFRTAWDVLPACNAVMILLYYSAKLLLAPAIRVRQAAPVAFWFGIACLFRFSLAPFLGLGLVIMLWNVRKRTSSNAVLVAVSLAVVMFVPTLIFNALRTGSPLRSAGTLPQFRDQTSLTGNLAKGMFGLLLSPNRGLFFYSPILLLLVLLPWCWRSMPSVVKSLLKAYLLPAFLYYLLIAKMLNWGAAGWGPRYLIPVLPILFLGAGAVAYELWSQPGVRRLLLVGLCLIGLVLSIPTLLVDYSNAVLQYPDPFSETTAYPIEHIAVWKELLTTLHGQAPQVRPNVGTAEESKLLMVFPDLLVMRIYTVLAERSKAIAEILLLLYVGAVGYVTYLLWLTGKREALTRNDGGFPGLTSAKEEASALR
jgi:hypothetical protein